MLLDSSGDERNVVHMHTDFGTVSIDDRSTDPWYTGHTPRFTIVMNALKFEDLANFEILDDSGTTYNLGEAIAALLEKWNRRSREAYEVLMAKLENRVPNLPVD
jgi:hypothetical protein